MTWPPQAIPVSYWLISKKYSETRIVCFGHVLNGSGRNKQYL
jgi:hypothetical protein